MDREKLIGLLVLSGTFLHVEGTLIADSFVSDIIEVFHSKSPAIIFEEHSPELCRTRQRMICVTLESDTEERDLADHFGGHT